MNRTIAKGNKSEAEAPTGEMIHGEKQWKDIYQDSTWYCTYLLVLMYTLLGKYLLLHHFSSSLKIKCEQHKHKESIKENEKKMSDFSKLLSQLQESAKAVSTSSTASITQQQPKRKASFHEQTQEAPRKRHVVMRPKDFNLLTIKISFLCIGAQKAGTTWLYHMLRKFDTLSLPRQKELHFFDWHRKRGLDWYSRQFGSQSSGKLLGEITPDYVSISEHQIREIRYLFPSVKIVFIARDIVDRAWSALLMELRTSALGLEAGEFPTEDEHKMSRLEREKYLKDADPDRYSDEYFLERLTHSTHSLRNDYATSLRLWLSIFPKEQILILNYNDISTEPRQFIHSVVTFIGLNSDDALRDSITDEDMKKRYNTTMDPKLKRPIRPSLKEKMERILQPNVENFNQLLAELGYTWRLK